MVFWSTTRLQGYMIMQYNDDMKTKPVTVTVPENIILEVKKMAEDQGRSFSNMVSLLLLEGTKKKAA
jgi:hypothetical protein